MWHFPRLFFSSSKTKIQNIWKVLSFITWLHSNLHMLNSILLKTSPIKVWRFLFLMFKKNYSTFFGKHWIFQFHIFNCIQNWFINPFISLFLFKKREIYCIWHENKKKICCKQQKWNKKTKSWTYQTQTNSLKWIESRMEKKLPIEFYNYCKMS